MKPAAPHRGRLRQSRMHKELLQRGHEVCEDTVASVMKQEGIVASTEKKFRVTTSMMPRLRQLIKSLADFDLPFFSGSAESREQRTLCSTH